jgi:glyoxylase-like metal-dependent hydrolase (beta-lactamase superfamily II)
MTELKRRDLLTGAAALTAAAATFSPASLTPALGQAAASGTSGVFRHKLGDAEVIQILEGIRLIKYPDNFIANASKEQLATLFEQAYMPGGIFRNPYCPVAVKSGGKTIVIDTGHGSGAIAQTNGEAGHHRANLAAAGIDAGAVDIVLISHFHGDHIGGLKNPDGTPAFPKAEIMVPATEHAFFTNEANMEKASPTNKGNFANVKKVFDGLKVTQFEAGKEVVPGITAIASPGHTPGHTSFVVASGNKRILIQGDIALAPDIFVKNPELQILFDNDKEVAVATRKKIYDMAVAEKLPVIGYHFPFGTVSYVEKAGNGYRLIAANGGIS